MRYRPIKFIRDFSFVLTCVLTVGNLSASRGNGAKQRLSGTLVDITCATDPKRDLIRLRNEHTRKCLLMPICAESGYGLLTDQDEVLRFDVKGNDLARKVIEKHSHNQKWRVSIVGTVEEDKIAVEHIDLLRANES